MTTLTVDQIFEFASQPITVFRPIDLVSIRVKLYFHNLPDGLFYLCLKDGSSDILKIPFSSQSVKTTLSLDANYFWADLAFPCIASLSPKGYELRIECDNYLATTSSWFGWVKDWDGLYGQVIGSPDSFPNYPYSFRLIEANAREIN
jgi:hypothetical protein